MNVREKVLDIMKEVIGNKPESEISSLQVIEMIAYMEEEFNIEFEEEKYTIVFLKIQKL